MNDRYFAAQTSRQYIDAGYRWAYGELEEPGHITLGKLIDVDRVMAVESYWIPPKENASVWLEELLPKVRRFLDEHRDEPIVYCLDDTIWDERDDGIDWQQVDTQPSEATIRVNRKVADETTKRIREGKPLLGMRLIDFLRRRR
ncbi:MAG: hypothetical protein AAGK09_05740 [Planctomycetota bacterium]